MRRCYENASDDSHNTCVSRIFVLVVIGFWWTGFKSRLAKFLRESLRKMIVEELQQSRIAFVTWLREDAPWRGEGPFLPPPGETQKR
jgi:hypothetical protein